MGKSVAFYTLGCKVNHYETQAMRELFMQAGYEIKDFEDSADIYVINTCTVTNIADRKSRQMLHRAKKRNPDAVVAAVGCYAQGDADQLALDDAVDLVVGNDRKGGMSALSKMKSRTGRVRRTRNCWISMLCAPMNRCRFPVRRTRPVSTSRSRTAATSSVLTAGFPMSGGVSVPARKRISCRKCSASPEWAFRKPF